MEKKIDEKTGYYKYLKDWKEDSEEIAKEIYAMVDKMPNETFNCGEDWVRGYKRDLSHLLIERVVSPYNFFRDRKIASEKEDAIEFAPVVKSSEANERVKRECIGEGDCIIGWGPEGSATEFDDYFEFKYNDGRSAKVPKSSLNEKSNASGKFYTTRIKDIPTNVFPRGDGTKLWNIHEYKAR